MSKRPSQRHLINCFDFKKGDLIANKYEIQSKLGAGWEGEVYLTKEKETGIERTAKFFFPHRNPRNQTVRLYAKKLHRLRNSGILIQYHNHEKVRVKGMEVTCLISDYVEGELLSEFIERHKGGRLHVYEALSILHSLAAGVEGIHRIGEYHGDLHSGNVFLQQVGVRFQVKLIDLFDWRDSKPQNIRLDVCNLIRIFYDSIGGQKFYAKSPPEVKEICCGLKKTLINTKFRHAGHLRQFLENMHWSSPC